MYIQEKVRRLVAIVAVFMLTGSASLLSGNSSCDPANLGDLPYPPDAQTTADCAAPDTQASILPAGTAGRLDGVFEVDATGTAAYEIPIDVPSGINGFQPDLSLAYSSNGPNGPMGVGWRVTGLSSVSRCPKTLAQDGVAAGVDGTPSDRFCLDGRRLVLVSGPTYGAQDAEYRFEEDSHVRIYSRGSHRAAPEYFEVHFPDGNRAYYGRYQSHQTALVERQQYPGHPIESVVSWNWLIARAVDRYGNMVEFEYESANPSEAETRQAANIRYAGRRIEFVYETRTDPIRSSRAGISFRVSKRLRRMDVYAQPLGGAEALAWSYKLVYGQSPSTGRSRVDAIVKCDSADVCLPPTTFSWSEQEEGFDVVPVAGEFTLPAVNDRMLVGDWNGDGKDDLLYNLSDDGWLVRFADNGGFGPPEAQQRTERLGRAEDTRGVFPADFNGDGKTDLLARGPTGWHIFTWGTTGFERTVVSSWDAREDSVMPYDLFENNPNVDAAPTSLLDLNGDGAIDILYAFRCLLSCANDPITADWIPLLGQTWAVWSMRLGDGNGGFGPFQALPGHHVRSWSGGVFPVQSDDDPGSEWLHVSLRDHLQQGDYMFTVYESGTVPSERSSTSLGSFGYKHHAGILVLDQDGDGLTEFATETPLFGGGGNREIYSHNGVSWELQTPQTIPGASGPGVALQLSSFDYDGDGRSDIVSQFPEDMELVPQGVMIRLSRDGGYNQQQRVFDDMPAGARNSISITSPEGALRSARQYGPLPGDFNGDGLPDLVYTGSATSSTQQHVLLLRRGPHPDKIVEVVDGWGAKTRVEYAALHDGPHYDPGAPCSYPRACLTRGPVVATAYEHSNGIGGLRRYEKTYGRAQVDLRGRGWIGFSQVATIDVAAGILRTQVFDLSGEGSRYPRAGRPFQETTLTVLEDGSIHSSSHRWEYSLEEQFGGGTYRVYLESRTWYEEEIKTDGSGYSLNRDEQQEVLARDGFGNPSWIRNTIAGGDTTNTFRTYVNNEGAWLIGLLATDYVTASSANGMSASRSRAFGYTMEGALQQTMVAPNTALQHTTTLLRNSLGQVYSITEAAPGEQPRETTITYDANFGVHIRTITNAVGESQTFWTDEALGVVTHEIGVDGLCTARQYDSFGRARAVARPDGSATAWQYSSLGATLPWSVTVFGNDGSRSATDYDVLGRAVRERSLHERQLFQYEEVWVEQAFDPLGRVQSVKDAYYRGDTSSSVTSFDHDKLGRVVEATNSFGTRSWRYQGRTIVETDRAGVEHVREHDVHGRVVRAHSDGPLEPASTEIEFEYGPFGLLDEVRRGSATTSYTYDQDRGFRLSSVDPDGGVQSYGYNGFGETTLATNLLDSVEFVFDRLGRIERRTSDGITTYNYGVSGTERGKLVSETSEDGILTDYSYNAVGQLESEIVSVDGEAYQLGYQYDALGRLERTDYPVVAPGERLSLLHAYNDVGRHNNTRSLNVAGTPGAVGWTVGRRNASGQATQTYVGWHMSQEATYHPTTHLLDTIQTKRIPTDELVQNVSYQWSATGLLETRDDYVANRQEAFSHDEQRRLSSWQVDSLTSTDLHLYDYDGLGNMTYYDGKIQEYADPARPHQLTASGSDTSYDYDVLGRMVAGGSRSLEYTSFDLPRTVTVDGEITSFRYDASNSRTVKQRGANKTIYVRGVYEKRVENGITQHVHHLPGIAHVTWTDVGGSFLKTVNYVLTDHLGSISVITDADGRPIDRRQHTPFGRYMDESGAVLATPPPDEFRLGFAGHEHDDELRLVDMGGRVYDPETARMLSPDPFAVAPHDSQSWNPYSYAANSPVSAVDPTGFFWKTLLSGYVAMFSRQAILGRIFSRNIEGFILLGGSSPTGVAGDGGPSRWLSDGGGGSRTLLASFGGLQIFNSDGYVRTIDDAGGTSGSANYSETAVVDAVPSSARAGQGSAGASQVPGAGGGAPGSINPPSTVGTLAGVGAGAVVGAAIGQAASLAFAAVTLSAGAATALTVGGVGLVGYGIYQAAMGGALSRVVSGEATFGEAFSVGLLASGIVAGAVGGIRAIAAGRVGAAASSANLQFGQASVAKTFSNGPFKGQTIGNVAKDLRAGRVSPDDLPIEFVVRNGRAVALNNRSLTALRQAGVRPTKLINKTGVGRAEKTLDAHLRGGSPSDFIRVRGGPPRTSSIE